MINQGQHLINRMLGKKGPGNQAQNGANLAKPLFESPNFEIFLFSDLLRTHQITYDGKSKYLMKPKCKSMKLDLALILSTL